MGQAIAMSAGLIFALLLINTFANRISGLTDNDEFGNVIGSTMVIGLLYLVIIALFAGSVEVHGLPFIDKLNNYGSVTELFKNDFGVFILECAELISLTFIMSFISNLIPSDFGGKGITSKIIKSAIIVLIGVIANNFIISTIQETFIFSWAVSALQCFVSGANLILTPAMLIGQLLRLDTQSPMVNFLLKNLPQTKIGKSISTSTTNSLVFVFSIMLFESQCGGIATFMSQLPSIILMFFPSVMILIGISLMLKALRK